jgi:ubiquitin C-terminal hydrolase
MVLHGKDKDFYKLKLKGVIVHCGSADSGHYYTILYKDNMWKKYDDSRVSVFHSPFFESHCYGGSFV